MNGRLAIQVASCPCKPSSDFAAATPAQEPRFIASYGFEDHRRLTRKFSVPEGSDLAIT